MDKLGVVDLVFLGIGLDCKVVSNGAFESRLEAGEKECAIGTVDSGTEFKEPDSIMNAGGVLISFEPKGLEV